MLGTGDGKSKKVTNLIEIAVIDIEPTALS